MDNDNTRAAWQSRTVQLAGVAIIANMLKGVIPGFELDVTMQGYVVDLLPIIISGVMAAAIWFRVKARAIIDRWM